MKSLSLILVMAIVSSASFASEYEDRVREHDNNQEAVILQKSQRAFRQSDANFLRQLLNFSRRHGGLAAAPDCKAVFLTRDSEYSAATRQSCLGNFCVNIKVMAHYWGSDYQSQMLELFDNHISSCTVVLNDGLACEVSGGTPSCLDKNGNPR